MFVGFGLLLLAFSQAEVLTTSAKHDQNERKADQHHEVCELVCWN